VEELASRVSTLQVEGGREGERVGGMEGWRAGEMAGGRNGGREG